MNDRFKFRFWNSEHNCYADTDFIPEYVVSDGNIVDLGLEIINGAIPEQCTGLKDKNGSLIYEGDIVEITIFGSIGPNGGYVDSDEIYKGTVVWDRDCFLVKTDTDMLLFPHSEDCTEIIGNTHKQNNND